MASLLVVFLALLGSVNHVSGQTIFVNATCYSTYSWMNNGIGQSPCLVAAYLAGACNSGSWSVPAIPFNTSYAAPKGGNVTPCECSTVLYNLLQACSYCQEGWVQYWSDWTYNCPTSYISKSFPYPVPGATEIPPWALLDPTLLGYWSYTDAFAYAESPSASITPYVTTSSSTSPTSVMPISTTPLPSPSPTPTPLPEKKSSNIGGIAGGAVGGVAVLVFLILGIWYLHSRSAANHQPPSGGWAIEQGKSHWEQQEPRSPTFAKDEVSVTATSPTAGAFVTPLPYRPYDPSDPSTFPQAQTPSPPPRVAAPLPFNPAVTTPVIAESPSSQQQFGSAGLSAVSAPAPDKMALSPGPPAYVSRSGTIDYGRLTNI